jgi:hypothetical protein
MMRLHDEPVHGITLDDSDEITARSDRDGRRSVSITGGHGEYLIEFASKEQARLFATRLLRVVVAVVPETSPKPPSLARRRSRR